MIKNKPKNFKWTKEECRKEALKYNNRKDLKINNSYVYYKLLKYNLLSKLYKK